MTADPTEAERFLARCKTEHDADPDDWHRKMLDPPRTRSTACEFCGRPWTELDGSAPDLVDRRSERS